MRLSEDEYAQLDLIETYGKLAESFGCEIQFIDNCIFFTEKPDYQPKEGEERVYRFFGESSDLLRIAQGLDEKFDCVVDAFRGGGHAVIRIVKSGIAHSGIGIDTNQRATQIGNINAEINQIDHRVKNRHGSVKTDLPERQGKTLYVANPPFALAVKGAKIDSMRDGGKNGLDLTIAYLENAVEHSSEGDVIIGVAYSRIDSEEVPEIQSHLKRIVGDRGDFELRLVEDAKLWREFDGEKRSSNPMPITHLYKKADPNDKPEVDLYHEAAQDHLREGFGQLGYFEYVIKISTPRALKSAVSEKTKGTLK